MENQRSSKQKRFSLVRLVYKNYGYNTNSNKIIRLSLV